MCLKTLSILLTLEFPLLSLQSGMLLPPSTTHLHLWLWYIQHMLLFFFAFSSCMLTFLFDKNKITNNTN